MWFFYGLLFLVLWGMQALMGIWFATVWPSLSGRWVMLYVPVLLTVLTLGMIGYSNVHYHALARIGYFLAYTWFGFVFLGFCICTSFVILYYLCGGLHIMRGWMGPASVAVLLLIWGLAVWGGLSSPKVKRISLRIPNMPKMKIAVLADSHLGMGVSLTRFDKAMTRLEQENPDVLFAVGDIFEYGPNRMQYAVRLRKAQTPLGTYGVLGNHEYYVGYGDSKAFFQEAGITLLENTSVVLANGVQVVGLKDILTAGVTEKEMTELLSSLDKSSPVVLLSHTPKYAEAAAENGTNLMLSGHTHNGQLWPFEYLVRLQFPRVYGLFDVKGMKFYITSGMFYWGIPLRFLAPAEIPIIEVN
ncbi:MAG: metallophosphoesterase [Elusimicrobiaceae bacterium]|nr:metallophosphoesterase [Elusimicrobiaceae bacterium]